MAAEYVVDSQILSTALVRSMGIISLGDKAESNSITLVFAKKGLAIEAVNSAAAFRTEIPVEIKTATKQRVHVLPETLLSYAKGASKLTLIPEEQSLKVKGGKSLAADLYFVGKNENMEIATPDESINLTAIAAAAEQGLKLVGGIKNRTDSQVLGCMMNWGEDVLKMTVGDTHHAILVDIAIKSKHEGSILMSLTNLQKIIEVGGKFSTSGNQIIAWSDTDYLAIVSQSENIFSAESIRGTVENKRGLKAEIETEAFTKMIDTLTSSMSETDPIRFKITKDKLFALIKTSASSAKAVVKIESFKGEEVDTSVSVHHLRDCLSAIKTKTFVITMIDNVMTLESKTKTTKCIAAMAAVGN